jgi:hypothetical protein
MAVGAHLPTMHALTCTPAPAADTPLLQLSRTTPHHSPPPLQVLGSFTGPELTITLEPTSCPVLRDPDTGRQYVDFAECSAAELSIETTPCEAHAKGGPARCLPDHSTHLPCLVLRVDCCAAVGGRM